MKKLATLLGLGALALMVATPAAAFTNTVTNVFDDSFVGVFAKWRLKVNMTSTNSAVVTTTVKGEAETGENKIKSDDDMQNTSILTGDADAASLSDTTANSNALEENLNGSGNGSNTVDKVDDDSKVIAKVEDKNEENVTFSNAAVVNDEVETESETGDNEIDSGDSLTNGHIVSGKALTASGAVKLLNSNIKSIIRY